jgi:hypothetical protein
MRVSRSRSVLFLGIGCLFLIISVLVMLPSLFASEKVMHVGGQSFRYCEGWGCLWLADFEVMRMENGRVTGETVFLCKFHRSNLHDPLYVPSPRHRSDMIGMALLLLFTSLLFLIPGTRMGVKAAAPRGKRD